MKRQVEREVLNGRFTGWPSDPTRKQPPFLFQMQISSDGPKTNNKQLSAVNTAKFVESVVSID